VRLTLIIREKKAHKLPRMWIGRRHAALTCSSGGRSALYNNVTAHGLRIHSEVGLQPRLIESNCLLGPDWRREVHAIWEGRSGHAVASGVAGVCRCSAIERMTRVQHHRHRQTKSWSSQSTVVNSDGGGDVASNGGGRGRVSKIGQTKTVPR
jgi:hypothetical protein